MSNPAPAPDPDRFVPIFEALAQARDHAEAARDQFERSDAQIREAMHHLAAAMGIFVEPPLAAKNPPQNSSGVSRGRPR